MCSPRAHGSVLRPLPDRLAALISPLPDWTRARTGLGPGLDAAALERWQLERLGRVIEYARGHSRFYGERLAGVPALATLADLSRLPFTWPAEVAGAPLAFLCVAQSEVARVATLTTSGSTGARKRIFFTAQDLERTVDFFAHGMSALVRPGQDTLILMSGTTEHSIGRLLQAGLNRIGVTGRIGAPGWGAGEALRAARTAHCLVGLPAELFWLCRAEPGLRPASVLLSADFAPPSVIAALRAAWHCRVFTHYGLTETGYGCAVQCGAGEGHHLRDPDLLLEIVDPETGTRLGPGALGEIVITTLGNQAMPLLRYRTGDLARMLDGPSRCGGTLPRLGRVEGRRENAIPLGGGASLSIHQLDELVCAMPGVHGFQAGLRRAGGRITLELTVAAEGPLDPDRLRAGLPPGLAVEVRYAEVSPFADRGKRRILALP